MEVIKRLKSDENIPQCQVRALMSCHCYYLCEDYERIQGCFPGKTKDEGMVDTVLFFFKAAHIGVQGLDSGAQLPGSRFQILTRKSCVLQ